LRRKPKQAVASSLSSNKDFLVERSFHGDRAKQVQHKLSRRRAGVKMRRATLLAWSQATNSRRCVTDRARRSRQARNRSRLRAQLAHIRAFMNVLERAAHSLQPINDFAHMPDRARQAVDFRDNQGITFMPAIFEPRPKHLWMPQQTDTRQHDISARRL
jgi:hypothetical protein